MMVTGNLATYKNRADNIQTFTYDNLNRPVRFDWNDGATSWQTTAYDATSRVSQLKNWDATINFTYFNDNLLKTQQELTGGNYDHTNTYSYDADGNRASITYPSTYLLQYNYTGRNQLISLYLPNYGTVASYVYDRAGNRQQRSLHNQTVTDYGAVDALNRSAWVQHTFGGSQTARFDYDFDEVSRLKYERRDSGAADGYTYDQAGQVTAIIPNGTFNNGTVTGGSADVSYDANGNRTGAWGNTYSVNNLNEYTSVNGASAVSDSKGNLKTYNGWTYTYDAQNRLTSAFNGSTLLEFWYDPLNRQIARRINGGAVTRSVWDGWNLIEERDQNDAPLEYYLHGARTDELVVRFGGAYGTTWYCQDGRGNTSHMVGDGNEVLERYKYGLAGGPQIFDASGNGRSQSAWDNRFLFQGRDYLKEGGLYDYRNRFYLFGLGRFLQSDPIGFGGDANNLYRYCGNNPANGSDPTGLSGTLTIYSDYGNVFAGLWRGETGHTWISFTSDNTGITSYYATDPGGMRYNDWDTRGYTGDVMRQAWINDGAEASLNEAIRDFQGLERPWSIYGDCTQFAMYAWSRATGEAISSLNFGGIGSPSTVADSIMQLNGGHDYAFHFADGGNGYYFDNGSFGRYDSDGNGYYIWDPNGSPGDIIGKTTDGKVITQPDRRGGGGGASAWNRGGSAYPSSDPYLGYSHWGGSTQSRIPVLRAAH